MISAVLLCSGCLAALPAGAGDTDRDRDLASYEAAQATAGRDPEAHIRLALWCEAHGLQAERIKHLAIAVVTDPANATARGLMGLVAYRGRWQRPEAVGKRVEADADLKSILERYHEKRLQAPYTADGQWKVARWCEDNGLKEQARAHLMVVTSLDPGREAAWKRLGYKKVDGRWSTPEKIALDLAERQKQKEADKKWISTLERLKDQLASKSRRLDAEDALSRVVDPRAVTAICQVFNKNQASQAIAVRLLGQIDSSRSSQSLAVLAVYSPHLEIRRAASETLVRRDPREFAGWLADLLRKPVKYEVKPVGGPGSPGVLFVEGSEFNVKRLYSPPAGPTLQPGDNLSLDASGLPVATRVLGYVETPRLSQAQIDAYRGVNVDPNQVSKTLDVNGLSADQRSQMQQLAGTLVKNIKNRPLPIVGRGTGGATTRLVLPSLAQIPVGQMALEAQAAAQTAERQLENDLASIKQYNAPIVELNERVKSIFTKVTDADLGDDLESWKKWAVDLQGYAYLPQSVSRDTPTVLEQVPIAYQGQAAPIFGLGAPVAAIRSHSCFGGGTLVSTLAGPRPIEDLRTGDQVLAQDTTTGGLSYQPLVAVFHNPPNQTLRIEIGGDPVVVTGIHRFWKAGRGWTMARELKVGDRVRTVGGIATVDAVASDQVQPVFNLQVAEGQSFFVGRNRALVHDNSLVETVAEPFDATPVLEEVARTD